MSVLYSINKVLKRRKNTEEYTSEPSQMMTPIFFCACLAATSALPNKKFKFNEHLLAVGHIKLHPQKDLMKLNTIMIFTTGDCYLQNGLIVAII